MITGSVIFYLHTDNQILVMYIIGLQIGISLLIPRAGEGGGVFIFTDFCRLFYIYKKKLTRC